MSHSVVHGNSEEAASPTPKAFLPERTERRLRQWFAWIILYLLLQAELGLAWDRRWHDYLGRDQFWIPPHIMIYSGIGLAGLLTLFFILLDTRRYRQHAPGVDDSSTITVLRYFHAPLGFILLGFGALTDLVAAPFDNYWHELYGIDVTLWAPFHLMGTFGGIMVGVGAIYALASEAAYTRHALYPPRRFLGMNAPEWGILILFAALVELALPALTAFATLTLGSWQFITYPLPLALAAFFPIAAVQSTRKPGAATVVSLLVSLLSLITQSYIPYALRFTAAHFGLTFRISAGVLVFNITLVLIPLLFLCGSLLLDSIAYYQQHHQPEQFAKTGLHGAWLFGIVITLLALFIPSCLVLLLTHFAPTVPLPMDIATTLAPNWPATLLTAPFALLIGLLGVWLGTIFGDIWHWNKR